MNMDEASDFEIILQYLKKLMCHDKIKKIGEDPLFNM